MKAMSKEQASEYINNLIVTTDKYFGNHVEKAIYLKLKQALEDRDGIEKKMKEIQEQLEKGRQLLVRTAGETEALGTLLVQLEDDRRSELSAGPTPTKEELEALKDKE